MGHKFPKLPDLSTLQYMTITILLSFILYRSYQVAPEVSRIILPEVKVSEQPKKDKPTIVKAAPLHVKATQFIYNELEAIADGKPYEDRFMLSPRYPREWQEQGFLVVMKDKQGVLYYAWTKFKVLQGTSVKGWFIKVNGSWQYNKKQYIDIIIPIVERKPKPKF